MVLLRSSSREQTTHIYSHLYTGRPSGRLRRDPIRHQWVAEDARCNHKILEDILPKLGLHLLLEALLLPDAACDGQYGSGVGGFWRRVARAPEAVARESVAWPLPRAVLSFPEPPSTRPEEAQKPSFGHA